MAWTATLVEQAAHPQNPQMVRAVVRFTDGAESLDIPIWGTDINAEYLRHWTRTIIANLAARDAAASSLEGVTAIVPADPPQPKASDIASDIARNANRAAMGLRVMRDTYTDLVVVGAIQNRIQQIESQLKAYMAANPTLKPEDLL